MHSGSFENSANNEREIDSSYSSNPEKTTFDENDNYMVPKRGIIIRAFCALFNSIMDWISYFTGALKGKPRMHHVVDSCQCNTKKIISIIYPVGSIYLSASPCNPSNIFEGTKWVRWGNGRVPVGVDEKTDIFSTSEKTGGERNVTLKEDNLPQGTCTSHFYKNLESGAAYNTLNGSWGIGDACHTFRNCGNAINNLQPYITCYMWKRIE